MCLHLRNILKLYDTIPNRNDGAIVIVLSSSAINRVFEIRTQECVRVEWDMSIHGLVQHHLIEM